METHLQWNRRRAGKFHSQLSTLRDCAHFYQSRVAEQICEVVPPDYTSSLNVVYFPQLGKRMRQS